MVEVAGSGKTTDLCFTPCRTHLPRTARATNSCTREEFSKRGELTNARSALVGVAETGVNALFDDFWYFWSHKSTKKEKWHYLKKTPHPSAYGCHLLLLSRRRRPSLLRKSVNSSQMELHKFQVPPTAKIKNITPSRQRTRSTHARQPYYAGVQACVHESARLFRALCSHAW